MNIILTGFQGSGKTTAAHLLAARLDLPRYDTDELLLQRFSSPTIRDLFDTLGEREFRKQEDEVLASLTGHYVLALGGGAVREYVRQMGCVFYLYLPKNRLKINPKASFLRDTTVEALFDERHPRYLSVSHHVIDTTDLDPQQVVELILQKALYGK